MVTPPEVVRVSTCLPIRRGRSEVVERERPRASVHERDRLVQISIGHDGQHGPEDLLLHDPHVVMDVEDQRRRERVGATLRVLG